MKILLINPGQSHIYGRGRAQIYPPLGLLYIGAVLEKAGHEVRLLDIDAEAVTPEMLNQELAGFRPGLAGLTAVTATADQALNLAGAIKAYGDIPVVIGGIHATVSPETFLIPGGPVDFAVRGEGERTVTELALSLGKNERRFDEIQGLGWFRAGEMVLNPLRPLAEDLDSFPFPARHLLKNPGAYIPAYASQLPVTEILFSRGCTGRCSYCNSRNTFGSKVRYRSPANMVAELFYCIKEYGTKEFHIADDAFSADRIIAMEFCRLVRESGVKVTFNFFNGLRADQVDEELLLEFKKTGVVSLGFGVESGDAGVLSLAGKDMRIETVKSAYATAKKLGLHTWAFFMIGLPGETAGAIKKSIALARELAPDYAKFLIFKPFPGTAAYRQLDEKGLIADRDYSHYGVHGAPVHDLPGLSGRRMRYWQKRAYLEFYCNPADVLGRIKKIKNLQELKFNISSALFIIKKVFF